MIRTCLKFGIEFKTVTDEEDATLGAFSDYNRTLEISESPAPSVISILVHEYSHMLQWINKDEAYIATYRGLDPTTVVNEWIEGKDFLDIELDNCFYLTKKLEFECDRRAVEVIKKWKLPIDIEYYTKCSIGYAYYYDYIRKHRKWGNVAAYESPEVLEKIKADFDSVDLTKIDDEIVSLIEKQKEQIRPEVIMYGYKTNKFKLNDKVMRRNCVGAGICTVANPYSQSKDRIVIVDQYGRTERVSQNQLRKLSRAELSVCNAYRKLLEDVKTGE